MAEHTLGHPPQGRRRPVRIFGEEYDVRATVETIDGYSAATKMAWFVGP